MLKKIFIGSISGLCLLGTLSSCGENSDNHATTNSADVIDDKVKVTYKNDIYSEESYSTLASTSGKEFEKGDSLEFAFNIKGNIRIKSISYNVKYDGGEAYVGYPTVVKHYDKIDDSVFEDWNVTYTSYNTDRGKGEHCSDLETSYSFSLRTTVFLSPSASIKQEYIKDTKYLDTKTYATLSESVIDYTTTKKASISDLTINASKGDWLRISFNTYAGCSYSYNYLWYMYGSYETTSSEDGYKDFHSQKLTVSDFKIDYEKI